MGIVQCLLWLLLFWSLLFMHSLPTMTNFVCHENSWYVKIGLNFG